MRKARILTALLAVVMIISMMPVSVLAANPYLPVWERIPDGEPRLFEDPDNPGMYRAYIYGSRDGLDPAIYCSYNHVVWSAPAEDLTDWRYEGEVFHRDWTKGLMSSDGKLYTYEHPATALYAPDVVYNPVTKKYYLYTFTCEPDNSGQINTGYYEGEVPNGDMIPRVWVAESDSPAGPFDENIRSCDAGWYIEGDKAGTPFDAQTPVAAGTPPAPDALHPGGFDPAVYVEVTDTDAEGNPTDFKAYIYWGFRTPWAAELEKDMVTIKRDTIRVAEGFLQNAEDGRAHGFFEASSLRKIDDTYVLVYSALASLNYAVSDNPLGPFTFQGTIYSTDGERVANPYGSGNVNTWSGNNNHGSLLEVEGQWYIFGHRHTNEPYNLQSYLRFPTQAKRQSIVDPVKLYFEGDKLVIEQAQMTSMGFELDGLDPYKEQDAAIMCYKVPSSANQSYIRARTFDESKWVNWNELPELEGMDWNPVVIRNNGSVKIGYRYFNFGEGVAPNAGLSLLLTMKETALAEGRVLNVYAGAAKENYGDPEPEQFLIASTVLQGNIDLHTLELPITQNLDKLDGMVGIYLEFLRGETTTNDVLNDVVNLNKLQFKEVGPLSLSTDAHQVKAGEFIPIDVAFNEEQESNTVILNFTFDAEKFRYNGYSVDNQENVGLVDYDSGEGWAKVTLMIQDYKALDLGYLGLVAKDDAPLVRGREMVQVSAEYVLRDEEGNKTVAVTKATTSFTTMGDGNGGPGLPGDTNEDGVVDILDLSNIIDWFGFTSKNQSDWDSWYTHFDFNNNGEIDISDITYVAKLIGK